MRSKKKDVILIILFGVFLGAFGLMYLVLPLQRFSVNEKRVLQSAPALTSRNLFNGKFGTDFETYLSDHFALRDIFVGMNSYYDLGTGRNGVTGIYAGANGYLIETPVEYEQQNVDKNIEAIAKFSAEVGIRPDFMLVPSVGYIYDDKLPALHFPYTDDKIIASIESALGESVDPVDLIQPLKAGKDEEQLYFKTDHHWTGRGAYVAYQAYCAEKKLQPVSMDRFRVQAESGFYGTTYSRSALWLSGPDTIELFWDKSDPKFRVEIPDNKKTYDSLFFLSHLNEPDKYPVYLDGNHGYEKITNKSAKGGKLLLIKDSYAHAIVQFLAENYSEIYMVDMRYYRESLTELVKENGIDSILFLYGVNNFVNDTGLPLMK